MRPGALLRAIVLATPSPYPASFDGSTLRFTLALFSLLSMAVVGSMVMAWMGREIWRGRTDAYPSEPLFAMRGVFFMAAFCAFLRSSPEAAMMITWRENVAVAGIMLMVKRWCDAVAFFPAMGWMGTTFIFYPKICMSLVRMARTEGGKPFGVVVPRERMVKLGVTLVTIFMISILIAVGKRW